ncbi:sulfotransferase family 2 domain-containing protein [cf. Phormidesmis sp. LEGE 11477]|uniref:sulfotransferase family 2 domain-containing protein n=1 Tax=cf. Phormidesmis sp. LEGE 11477 TaxID=1828680 RepID=UPI0018818518|nr:sulfotransferase family 2 domain-containing protein [cf. Phormidesmis sp. LEGE 11477]MBE9061356.1 sulfotransferase family 2 domain-containing protein [cf. Phormidesmis sp. LEGE 11477]
MKKSRYYKYARNNVRCDCPLCKCPYRNKGQYSFVFVSEEKKIIYYDIPKCASSTIRKLLFDNVNELSLNNPKDPLSEYFKFSFSRNPWDRIVSNWKMFTSQPMRIDQLKSMTDRDLSSFRDFVLFAKQVNNHHWQPQFRFLPDELDFLGKIENFEADFHTLCDVIQQSDIKPNGLRLNSTTRLPYRDYYTSETIEAVAEMYSEDIEMFKYSFDG